MEKTKKNNGKKNPYIESMNEDVLYHIGLSSGSQDLKAMFGDIKFVCMGGTPQRMENFAHFMRKELGYQIPTGTALVDISKHSHRYAMYKVGPVLSVSHGMGVPSLSILLHELIKLMWHAGVEDPIFFRIGTCGGVGLTGGTVVVTEEAVDGRLLPVHENIVLGKIVQNEAKLDADLAKELVSLGGNFDFKTRTGKTVCTNDFYEGQARLDGAFCSYTESQKMEYLQWLKENGVSNIEMESTCFAALTHMGGIKSAIVCVALLDRLNEDQLTPTKETMQEWQSRPQRLVSQFIKNHIFNNGKCGRSRRTTFQPNEILAYEDEGPGAKLASEA